jgi:hypothetical protein
VFNVPEPVLAAISTGEVPSLGDISNLDEANQIIHLAGSRLEAVTFILLATERERKPLPEHVIAQLINSDPSVAAAIVGTATSFADSDSWSISRRLILLIVQHASTAIQLEDFIFFLRRCITAGVTHEAHALFIETGMTERWAPLYEALCVIMNGDASQLDRLAPEMRDVARTLYEQLRLPVFSLADEASDSAPPKRRPAAKHALPRKPRLEPGKPAGRVRPRSKRS